MKTKQIILVLACVLSQALTVDAASFGSALKNREIKFEVKAVNGPRRMLLKIKNLLKKETEVTLEAGRFFYTDGEIQPFVISRNMIVMLDPGEETEVPIRGYCGNSSWGCPMLNQKFGRTSMGPDNLCNTLEMMNTKRIVDESLYQQVIWFYTNKHQIGAIYSSTSDSLTNLSVVRFICSNESIRPPQYRIKYRPATSGDELEFSGVPDVVEGSIQFNLEQAANVSLKVCDKDGKSVEMLGVYLNQTEGEIEIPINIDVSKFPLGHYTVKAVDDSGQVLAHKDIQVM
jgi:hypothetical protein